MDCRRAASPMYTRQWSGSCTGSSSPGTGLSTIKRNQNFAANAAAQRLAQEDRVVPLKECAISIALAIGLITGVPALDWCNYANAVTPAVLLELSGLILGPPSQDPRALLSYALPIDNKAIREIQKPLEDITDSLKIAGLKALDSVERNVRQACFCTRI